MSTEQTAALLVGMIRAFRKTQWPKECDIAAWEYHGETALRVLERQWALLDGNDVSRMIQHVEVELNQ